MLEALKALARAVDLAIEQEFRAIGFTLAAATYPLSQRAFEWRCRFNGIAPARVPPAWRYAPNAYMQAWLDEKGAA